MKLSKFPTKEAFEWAIFLYNQMGGYDDSYFDARLKLERSMVKGSPGEDLIWFLNQWKTRVKKTAEVPVNEWYKENTDLLKLLTNNLSNTNLDDLRNKEIIKKLYNSLDAVYRIGSTATAKILHMLKPDLFIPWDDAIKTHYLSDYQGEEEGEKYLFFMKKMQNFVKVIDQKEAQKLLDGIIILYTERFDNESDPEKKAKFKERVVVLESKGKSLAKFIDEYNWITITNEIPLPPKWHPN